mmetsp:Transcript_19498/g.62034  ORF Transcript_19498/g.62034 Transcript_19498/m.62034 type:complete len:273 (-) Transcript_19498:551-1369(-)
MSHLCHIAAPLLPLTSTLQPSLQLCSRHHNLHHPALLLQPRPRKPPAQLRQHRLLRASPLVAERRVRAVASPRPVRQGPPRELGHRQLRQARGLAHLVQCEWRQLCGQRKAVLGAGRTRGRTRTRGGIRPLPQQPCPQLRQTPLAVRQQQRLSLRRGHHELQIRGRQRHGLWRSGPGGCSVLRSRSTSMARFRLGPRRCGGSDVAGVDTSRVCGLCGGVGGSSSAGVGSGSSRVVGCRPGGPRNSHVPHAQHGRRQLRRSAPGGVAQVRFVR